MQQSEERIDLKNNAGHLSKKEIRQRNGSQVEFETFNASDVLLTAKGLEKLMDLQEVYVIPEGVERNLVYLYCFDYQEVNRIQTMFQDGKVARTYTTDTGYVAPHPEWKHMEVLLKECKNILFKLQNILKRKIHEVASPVLDVQSELKINGSSASSSLQAFL